MPSDPLEEIFNIKIGFLFQNNDFFEKAVKGLNSENLIPLGHYLESVRFWSNQLIDEIWNNYKHNDWSLNSPELKIIDWPIVHVDLPQVFGIPVNLYAIKVINRCCILVEDLIVYGFQFHRFSSIVIREIRQVERERFQNRRFQAYPKLQGVIPSYPVFNDEVEIF